MPSSWETVSVSNKRGKKEQESASPSSRSKSQKSTSAKTDANSTRTPSGYFAALENVLPGDSGSAESDEEPVNVTPSRKQKPVAEAPVLKKTPSAQNNVPKESGPKESPKAARKSQDVDHGLKELSQLDASTLETSIKTLLRFPPGEPLRALAEVLDGEVNKISNVSMPLLANKSFALQASDSQSPLSYTPKPVIDVLSTTIKGLDVKKGYAGLAKSLIEAEKKGMASGKSNARATIAPAILLQLIADEYPALLEEDPSPIDELMESYSTSFGQNPAVGHSLIWLSAGQGRHGKGRKLHVRPGGLSAWMRHFLSMWTSPSSSNAGSVEAVALEYLHLLVDSCRGLAKHGHEDSDLPLVRTADIVSLLRAVKGHNSPLAAKKNGEKAQTALKEAYGFLTKSLFSGNHKHSGVALQELPQDAFVLFLGELKNETDPAIREELLDILVNLVTSKKHASPTSSRNGYQSSVLRAWVSAYEQHIIASRLLVRRLTEETKRGKTWKRHQGTEMLRAVKDMRSHNQKLLKRIEKRRQKEKNGTMKATPILLAHPELADDDVHAVDHDLQVLQKRLTSQNASIRSTLARLSIWSLIAYIFWYSVNNVLCAPDSRLPCPLSHPQYRHFKTNVWDKKIVPVYEQAYQTVEHSAKPYVVPALASAQEAFAPVKKQVNEKWERFSKTEQYASLHDFLALYIRPWINRVEQEFHDAIFLSVRTIVPAVQKASIYVQSAIRTYVPELRMHVATGAKDLRKYANNGYVFAKKHVVETLERFHVSEHVQRLVKPYEKSLGPFRAAAAGWFNRWVDGVDFLWRIVENRVDIKEWNGLIQWVDQFWATALGRPDHVSWVNWWKGDKKQD
ncbi:hypothetical protein DFJ77DRAFT_447744 [Powellomyces hirtus]|nr:hypothetical protein DFJ77DRAFT_447744 [Powellomyces hirtus]